MKILKTLRNYFCYCGIEKDEYNALKKDAYVSNFNVWKNIHFMMTAVFGLLLVASLLVESLNSNTLFYLMALAYSAAASFLFCVLKKDSLAAQLVIYLSISLLFLLGCFITRNKPEKNAVTFMVMLILAPLLMIDKPYFMALELTVSAAIFSAWMHGIKPYDVWHFDMINIFTFTPVGIFLSIIANSIRIKEFVLTREIRIQKDTDDLTGLMNKGALTREINRFLADTSADKGIMFLLDADHFKAINDIYGHDIGDSVINQLGRFLGEKFTEGEIVGRFGGDEFILFIKNTNDPDAARRTAEMMISEAPEHILLPDKEKRISISIGISLYNGSETNYSEIFKKADTALYRAKADNENRYCIYQ